MSGDFLHPIYIGTKCQVEMGRNNEKEARKIALLTNKEELPKYLWVKYFWFFNYLLNKTLIFVVQ